MNTVAQRIFAWSIGGALYGFLQAAWNAISWQIILFSLLIGAFAGAVGGAMASIRAPKFVQALITGLGVALCASIPSYYFLGSSHTLLDYVTGKVVAVVIAFLLARYLIGPKPGRQTFFAPSPQEEASLQG